MNTNRPNKAASQTSRRSWLMLPLIFLSSSCCELTIDQICYRTANANQVENLGVVGHKRANFGIHKGFEQVGFPKTPSDIPLTISDMKLLAKADGKMAVKANATSESIKEIVDAGGSISTTWDNSSSMVVRTISFQSPYLYRNALNSLENEYLRMELKKKGNQARIVGRIVKAYDHKKITSSTFTGELNGSLASAGTAAGPSASIEVNSNQRTEREVKDGTIVGYEWYKVIWSKTSPNTIEDLKLDSTFID